MLIKYVTLFPELYEPFKMSGPIRKALEKGLITMSAYNLKDNGIGKHKKVDETPYGGGAGMLLMVEPVVKSIRDASSKNSKVIMFTPEGKTVNQEMIHNLSKEEDLVFVSGYYEGFDNRIKDYVDMEISLGDFIVSRGDIPIITTIDAISRVIDGVINNSSIEEESFNNNLLEYPQYTIPREFEGRLVPEVLTNGNHKKIKEYRLNESLKRTKENRLDLYNKYKENKNGS